MACKRVGVRGTRLWVAFSALALVTLIGEEATAQAWVQPKGSVYLKTSVSVLYYHVSLPIYGKPDHQ